MAEKSNKVLLQVKGLKVAYGGIQAVKGVDFEVREGELVSLIGSNGAGKTTTMKAITGTLGMNDGDIEYLGQSIRGKGAWDLVKQGLVMVPEGRGVFARMTITENLLMGAYTRKDKAGIQADIEKMFTIFPRLRERKDQLAGTMSGGEQQMLAMGRALMSQPKVQDLRGGARRVRPGRDHRAGGAERQPGPGHRRPRLRDGVRPDHHDRSRPAAAERPQGARGLPGRVTPFRACCDARARQQKARLDKPRFLFFGAPCVRTGTARPRWSGSRGRRRQRT